MRLTHKGDSQAGSGVIHHGERWEALHGGGDRAAFGLFGR
jgi:hypothetical protein